MQATTSHSEHSEGSIARTIEQHTAAWPSDWFLWAALGSIATSLTLQVRGNRHASAFIGQWAPTLLILGAYNKLVKQLGTDATDRVRG